MTKANRNEVNGVSEAHSPTPYMKTYIINVPHSSMERTEDGKGWKRVEKPDTQERILIAVDVDDIAESLGRRACQNKSGIAKFLHGKIVVKHISSEAALKLAGENGASI